MPLLRMPADKKRQPHIFQRRKGIAAPCFCADCWRRKVATFARIPRKAKCHRENGNLGFVVKHSILKPHPFSQAVSGRVGKRSPALVNACTRGLPRNQNARRRVKPRNRTRCVLRGGGGEPISTNLTGLDLVQQGHGAIVGQITRILNSILFRQYSKYFLRCQFISIFLEI